MPKLLAVPNIDKFAHLISEQRKVFKLSFACLFYFYFWINSSVCISSSDQHFGCTWLCKNRNMSCGWLLNFGIRNSRLLMLIYINMKGLGCMNMVTEVCLLVNVSIFMVCCYKWSNLFNKCFSKHQAKLPYFIHFSRALFWTMLHT